MNLTVSRHLFGIRPRRFLWLIRLATEDLQYLASRWDDQPPGDPHLLCPPASWTTVAVFFIGNYLSHAATVKLPPAVSVAENIWICFTALLMPAAGLYCGLLAFSQAFRGRH